MVTKSRKKGNTTNMPSSLPNNELDTNAKQKRCNSSPSSTQKLHHTIQRLFSIASSTSFTLTSIAVILFSPLLDDDPLQPILLRAAFGYLFLVRPLFSIVGVCLSNTSNTHERVIAASFLMAIICNQLPKWMSCFVASSVVLGFGLASRQMTNNRYDNNRTDCNSEILETTSLVSNHTTKTQQNVLLQKWSNLTLKERAGLATLLVVLSLLLENFLIWVVSATYTPGITGSPTPLQDNGRIVLEGVVGRLFNVDNYLAKRHLQSIRDGLNVQWAIVAGLGASFVCLELDIGSATTTNNNNNRGYHRTLAGLALRALTTLSTARIIRTISFILTVLPSQIPNCYRRHFPPPPNTWKEWLLVGFLPNSRGGCNDLILSGHATVLTTLGCGCTSVCGNIKFGLAVWMLVVVDFGIEAYQGLHYSVDMWLGGVVCGLLWQLTQGLERPGEVELRKMNGEKVKMSNGGSQVPLDGQVVALYSVPAYLGFVILTFVPEAIVNYFLVGYAVWAGVIMVKWGFTNFSQHILLCLLFVTLGSYL